MVKPAKFDHPHLIHLFTTPLSLHMNEMENEKRTSITLPITLQLLKLRHLQKNLSTTLSFNFFCFDVVCAGADCFKISVDSVNDNKFISWFV